LPKTKAKEKMQTRARGEKKDFHKRKKECQKSSPRNHGNQKMVEQELLRNRGELPIQISIPS
jgi:hypothetical protein